jgi:hypothetical protein
MRVNAIVAFWHGNRPRPGISEQSVTDTGIVDDWNSKRDWLTNDNGERNVKGTRRARSYYASTGESSWSTGEEGEQMENRHLDARI